MIKEQLLYGVHALTEALQSATPVNMIYLKKGLSSDEVRTIRQLARDAEVPIKEVPLEKLNRLTRKAHQGCVAVASPIEYTHLEQLVPMLFEQGKEPLLMVLDELTDVRNFGAIARSAECFGCHGIIITQYNNVSVTADAVNASAGALLRIPVARVAALPKALSYLKESGIRLAAASEKGSFSCTEAPLSGPLALIMGNEHHGIAERTLSFADLTVTIPMIGRISSLNVSVAAGILLFEAARQRNNRASTNYNK